MKKATPEKAIENQILNFLSTIGIFAWKNQSVGVYDARKGVYRKAQGVHQIKGVSDVLGLVGGRFLAIEVKSPKGRLTPEQRQFLARINAEGGIAFVARSIEQVALSLAPCVPTNERLQSYARDYAKRAKALEARHDSH